MRIARLAFPALTVAALLSGCSGFWTKPETPTPPTTKSSGFFYVSDLASSQIAAFYVNSGTTTTVTGSPYTLSAAAIAMAVSPNNQFMYVSTLSGIYLYTISTSTGQLTLGNSNEAISADQAASLVVDSTNSWVIEAFTGQPTLFAIHVDPSTGLVATKIPASVGLPASTIQEIAISPDNTKVFVAMGAGGTAVIPFNSNNSNPFGNVATISPLSASGGALSVAVDPITTTTTTPRLFYVGETAAVSGSNTGGLRAFNYGTLQEITGSPFGINGLSPVGILPFSTGDYVYVLNRQVSGSTAGVITGFSIATSGSTYSLTALGETFPTGTTPQAIVEDNTTNFIFVSNFGGSPDLTGYVIDSTNAGYLDKVISTATGTEPVQANTIVALH
jgi:6-phosphogluconolactonase